MKFGAVPDISAIDFTLPDDHQITQALPETQPETPLYIHAGLAKWSRKEWLGTVYPRHARIKDFLHYYSRTFNSVELNATGYSFKSLKSIPDWRSQVPDDFTFSPKAPRAITHYKQLKGRAIDDTRYFLDAVIGFGECLGLPFLQLPEKFSPKRTNVLEKFLNELAPQQLLAIELRHEGWFSDPAVITQIAGLFRNHNISWVITDTAGRRDTIHQVLTSDSVLIRFQGSDAAAKDDERIAAWCDRLVKWRRKGLKHVYWYAHHSLESETPHQCMQFLKRISKDIPVVTRDVRLHSPDTVS